MYSQGDLIKRGKYFKPNIILNIGSQMMPKGDAKDQIDNYLLNDDM